MVAAGDCRHRRGRAMRLLSGTLPAVLCVLLVTGCELLTATAFPQYYRYVEQIEDVSELVQDVLDGQPRAAYDMWALEMPSGDTRLLLLVTPLLEEGEIDPQPQLLVFDESAQLVGKYAQPNPLEFLSRPFVVAADGNLLVGVVVLDPVALTQFLALEPHGLTGFGVVTAETHLFSQPGGEARSFTLNFRTYDAGWAVIPASTGAINIASAAQKAAAIASAGTAEVPGFRLVGVKNELDGTATFLFSEPAEDLLHVARVNIQDVVTGVASEIINNGTTVASIDLANSFVYYTDDEVVVRRDTGWLVRYSYSGNERDRVVAERGVGRVFAFNPDGTRFYRFDPEVGSLAVFSTWW